MNAALLRRLDEAGFFVAPAGLPTDGIALLTAAFATAPADGGTQHVDIDAAVPHYAEWMRLSKIPIVREAAHAVLGAPPQAIRLHGRNPLPGFGQQGLHADARPRPAGEPWSVVTAIVMLDAFTPDNGATRVVPGSHRIVAPPAKTWAQPEAHHPEEQLVTGPAGSVLVFNGHLWHSGTRNRSQAARRAAQLTFQVA